MHNMTPWLTELDSQRPIQLLDSDRVTDVCVIGAGIAGMTTAFCILTTSEHSVVIIDAGRIGHGATGHNAGQVVAEFEKPLSDIIHEQGSVKTFASLRLLEHAWAELGTILQMIDEPNMMTEFIGYGGYASIEQFLVDMRTEHIKGQAGVEVFPALVSRESGWYDRLPPEYVGHVVVVDQLYIAGLLETTNSLYCAVIPQKKGVINSALLVERMHMFLSLHFPERYQLFEKTSVHGVEFALAIPEVLTNDYVVRASRVVLCTNGFENIFLHTKDGIPIDAFFHHAVDGAVGYMTGHLLHDIHAPLANYFYTPGALRTSDPFHSDPYFYVTRRPFAYRGVVGSLVTTGGPEVSLKNRELYKDAIALPQKSEQSIEAFLATHMDLKDNTKTFAWHGLMGYTNTGVRIVGSDALESRLYYNLGCNGVGILTSIMGAHMIGACIRGESLPETIFTPKKYT